MAHRIIKSKIVNEIPLKKGLYTFLNPFSYYKLVTQPELINEMDGIFVDGIALVSIYNHLSNSTKVRRNSFDATSLAPIVFDYAIR